MLNAQIFYANIWPLNIVENTQLASIMKHPARHSASTVQSRIGMQNRGKVFSS